jgi:hypothetical protein
MRKSRSKSCPPTRPRPWRSTQAELVRLELKAQRRALGVRQRQARGLRFKGQVADPLAAAGPVGVCVEAMLAAAAPTLQGLRDRALLSLAFDTGLRRSEIVAVQWWHVEAGSGESGGGRLFARGKTGADVWTPGAGLSAQSVTLVYRALLDAARDADLLGDIAEADFAHWRQALTAHSTRVGLTQDLFANGQDLAGIMHALRWKSPQQPARYAQALAVEANAAAKVVGRL